MNGVLGKTCSHCFRYSFVKFQKRMTMFVKGEFSMAPNTVAGMVIAGEKKKNHALTH